MSSASHFIGQNKISCKFFFSLIFYYIMLSVLLSYFFSVLGRKRRMVLAILTQLRGSSEWAEAWASCRKMTLGCWRLAGPGIGSLALIPRVIEDLSASKARLPSCHRTHHPSPNPTILHFHARIGVTNEGPPQNFTERSFNTMQYVYQPNFYLFWMNPLLKVPKWSSTEEIRNPCFLMSIKQKIRQITIE